MEDEIDVEQIIEKRLTKKGKTEIDKDSDCTEKRIQRPSKKIIEEKLAHCPKENPEDIKCSKEIIRCSTTKGTPKKERKPETVVENIVIKSKRERKETSKIKEYKSALTEIKKTNTEPRVKKHKPVTPQEEMYIIESLLEKKGSI